MTSKSGTFGTGLTLTTSGGSGTGAVSYTVSNGTASGCAVDAGVLTASGAGSCLVTASKAGDASFNPRPSDTDAVTFAKADQAALALTSNSGTFGSGLTLDDERGIGDRCCLVHGLDGTASGCAVDAGVLTVSGAGSCLVTASKAGDANFNPASSDTDAVTFAKADQAALMLTSNSGTFGIRVDR